MTIEQKNLLLTKIDQIFSTLPEQSKRSYNNYATFYIMVKQFIKDNFGVNSEFYRNLQIIEEKYYSGHEADKGNSAYQVLTAVQKFIELDLSENTNHDYYSYKIDAINDFILQSVKLINDKSYHPAAAAILLGASLEEFLKNLAEKKELDISTINKTIDPVAKKLYENNIISKQDMKDITSWAGIRNEATHGNFEEINDRKRISNAIEGVNLFMRKYNF